MIYSHVHLRTDNAAPVNFDLGDHEPIPPEAWRECGGTMHLVKRRAVQFCQVHWTVAVCAKCQRVLETLDHPASLQGRPPTTRTAPAVTVNREQVVAFLREHGPSTIRDITTALGMKHQAVGYALEHTPGVVKVDEKMQMRNGRMTGIWAVAG